MLAIFHCWPPWFFMARRSLIFPSRSLPRGPRCTRFLTLMCLPAAPSYSSVSHHGICRVLSAATSAMDPTSLVRRMYNKTASDCDQLPQLPTETPTAAAAGVGSTVFGLELLT